MLNFNWKFLTPLSLVVLVVTALLDKILESADRWIYVLAMLAANLIIGWMTILILKRFEPKRKSRRQEFDIRPVAVAPKPPASAES